MFITATRAQMCCAGHAQQSCWRINLCFCWLDARGSPSTSRNRGAWTVDYVDGRLRAHQMIKQKAGTVDPMLFNNALLIVGGYVQYLQSITCAEHYLASRIVGLHTLSHPRESNIALLDRHPVMTRETWPTAALPLMYHRGEAYSAVVYQRNDRPVYSIGV
jgi:hypothetical protein